MLKVKHLLTGAQSSFISDPATRRHLIPPSQVNVDFRAACFCHKKVVDIGFVCSICLSSGSPGRPTPYPLIYPLPYIFIISGPLPPGNPNNCKRRTVVRHTMPVRRPQIGFDRHSEAGIWQIDPTNISLLRFSSHVHLKRVLRLVKPLKRSILTDWNHSPQTVFCSPPQGAICTTCNTKLDVTGLGNYGGKPAVVLMRKKKTKKVKKVIGDANTTETSTPGTPSGP